MKKLKRAVKATECMATVTDGEITDAHWGATPEVFDEENAVIKAYIVPAAEYERLVRKGKKHGKA